ncbi:hypothetical protein Ddc_24554 [Ditylenchus destructor]|nr:hypothetical protein Ddc_24554 [Ditylenchus destructor]
MGVSAQVCNCIKSGILEIAVKHFRSAGLGFPESQATKIHCHQDRPKGSGARSNCGRPDLVFLKALLSINTKIAPNVVGRGKLAIGMVMNSEPADFTGRLAGSAHLSFFDAREYDDRAEPGNHCALSPSRPKK